MHLFNCRILLCLASASLGFWAERAAADQTLSPEQVLVVYDSRRAGGLEVAEFYAGSAAVPGGSGNEPGARPGVFTLDLASIAPPIVATNGTIQPEDFREQIRDPIRVHLINNGLVYRIRCLVLCKGLPHRLDDPLYPGSGDNPSQLGNLWSTGRARSASVDAELTLLWHNLDQIRPNVFHTLDLGYIVNPYWRQSRAINTYSNKDVLNEKEWTNVASGLTWTTASDDEAGVLTPGDIMLVCRLDGHTVADVRAMVERAAHIVYDVNNSAFILDESGSNGIADPTHNSELDNIADPVSRDDDYETARDVLLADGRFEAANIRYNASGGVSNFLLGPRVDFGGQGLLVTEPVVLLTHFGRNHAGRPSINIDRYEESFNLADGAVFSTMESFNGRAFNGLGTLVQQAQVADFIAAGGTFGIGMVWEPLAQTVPDSNRIVRGFMLGRLTWAEAAYTAIPTLSWMHVVIGDPLARAIASSEDINGDGVLDIEDLYAFEHNPADLNRDGAINDADRALLTAAIRAGDQHVHDAGRGLRDLLREAE